MAKEIDRDPARRHRIDEMKRAYLDAERLVTAHIGHHTIQEDVTGVVDFSSLLENEENVYLSTLRAYVEALGGELEISARFPDGEVIKVG